MTKAKLYTERKLEYVCGKNSKGNNFEFIGTQVSVNDENGKARVHDAIFDLTKWDDIAASACASATVWLVGELTHAKNPYIVNEGTEDAYERLLMARPELDDIVDTKGSAIAFSRGARLPNSETLKARYEAKAKTAATPAIEGNIV